MPLNLDRPTDRSHSCSLKHEAYAGDVIPMWVADTEFEAPDAVREALLERVTHGIFGYTLPGNALNQAVGDWAEEHYGWTIQPEWLVWLPGIVPGFNVACRAFGNNSRVAVQVPNYPPMLQAPANNSCTALQVHTSLKDGRWVLDKDSLVSALSDPACSLLLLCNPMNPCGTVLSREELEDISELARANNVTICSDEIHCDILMDENTRHTPMGMLNPQSVTLMAASKTFNIAGLSCSYAIIPDAGLREKFISAKAGLLSDPNLFGFLATRAAYEHGESWLKKMNAYLSQNRDYAVERINTMPGLSCQAPEATFLLWIDCRASELKDPYTFFLKHGVALSNGDAFGMPGYVRLNYGCQKAMLTEALNRMEQALCSIPKT